MKYLLIMLMLFGIAPIQAQENKNPFFAYKTLQIEENIGVFLPCKAIVKDIGNGTIEVVIVNPAALMGMLNKPELVTIAEEVSQKFHETLNSL